MANQAVTRDSLIGQTLDHYRIIEKIGAGGMGEVYRAHDEHLDRDVAIKVLPTGILADHASRKQFRKEALALSKLSHPSIAIIYDFDKQDSGHVKMRRRFRLSSLVLPENYCGRPTRFRRLAKRGSLRRGSNSLAIFKVSKPGARAA